MAQQGTMHQQDEAKTFSMGGNVVRFLLTGEETEGIYSVTEFIMAAPPAPGPPMHIHEVASEAIYVLEGELLFTLGEKSMKASEGSVLFVPGGTKHTLSNLGPGI